MSTYILEDICDGSQSHSSINRRDARYKIRDHVLKNQEKCKWALLWTQYMVKGSHKVFKAVCNGLSESIPIMVESGSGVFYFIPEPGNFAEVTRLSSDIRKLWLKTTLKEIKHLINNKNFLVNESEKGDPVSPCMNLHKSKIQSDGSIDKLKLIIVVRGDM